jgi:F-type H+-transporting ATPase subunit epsilon
MADGLKFELVSPERLLLSEDVTSVTVPGTEGDFTALVGHAPVLSTIRPGVITVRAEDGAERRYFVRGGFAEITSEGLTVLAEETTPMEELSAERLADEIKNAEDDVTDAKDDVVRQRAQEKLDHLRQLQSAL